MTGNIASDEPDMTRERRALPDDLTTATTEPMRFIQQSAQPTRQLGHRCTANGAPDLPASFGEVLGAAYFTIATRRCRDGRSAVRDPG